MLNFDVVMSDFVYCLLNGLNQVLINLLDAALQLTKHPLYFRHDFQMLVALMFSIHRALGHVYQRKYRRNFTEAKRWITETTHVAPIIKVSHRYPQRLDTIKIKLKFELESIIPLMIQFYSGARYNETEVLTFLIWTICP